MSDEKTLYVGDQEVDQISDQSKVDLIGVLYKNGKNEDFTVEQWEAVKSDEKYASGEVVIRKFAKLLQRVIKELVDARVSLAEYGFVLTRAKEALDRNCDTAFSKLFNKDLLGKVMLAEIHEVLIAEEDKEEEIKE